MEKRALLAFVLSLLVLFGYQYLVLNKAQKEGMRPSQQGTETVEEPVKVMPEISLNERPDVSKSMDEKEMPWTKTPIQERGLSPERLVQVETDLAFYSISTRDAAIQDIVLKEYKDDLGNPVHLIAEDNRYFPLQMTVEGQPMGLDFQPSQEDIKVDGQDRLVMTYTDTRGSKIEKIFKFEQKSYIVNIQLRQNILDSYHLLVGSSFLKTGEKEKTQYRSHSGPVLELQGEIERIDFKKIQERMNLPGDISWIAYEKKYFMTALFPEIRGTTATAERMDHKDGSNILFGLQGNDQEDMYAFYAGPKDYELLKSFNLGLEKVIDFGWFSFLAKPMFYILKTTYRYVRNYGIAIIILTTLIKLIFWPLTHKQQKSMKDMQKIQPEMNTIREKFKNDQQQMSREMMGLYKKHKVNPAAGCLPLVIQIPVFFALYNVLLNSIELRGAPFLYLKDLSAADTLFGQVSGFSVGPLPLLMGLTMYIQQKMMPTTMDPKQAKIFQFMPVIFTFMFLNFPSGLVLYWLVNNVLTIVQQFHINKKGKVTSP